MKRLHIEPTSRCTLACPACPRTTWHKLLGKPVNKNDFDFTLLKKFLDCESGNNVETFILCGDYGDSIYYPQLFEFITEHRNRNFVIHTNGSHRPKEWWKKLNNLLTKNDTIVFAVDGLGDENSKYRVNSNWQQIDCAIDELKNGPAKLECQTIIFSFNYNKLSEIEDWAQSKGMHWFSKKTHRFGDPSFEPPIEYAEEKEYYQNEYHQPLPMEIEPDCYRQSVITSDNYFLPCDWIRNPLTFYNSELFINKSKWLDRLHITDINLDQGISVLYKWIESVKEKGMNGQAEVLCKMKCRKCK